MWSAIVAPITAARKRMITAMYDSYTAYTIKGDHIDATSRKTF